MFILNNVLSFLGNMNIFFLRNKKFRLAICSEMVELCPFYQMGNSNSNQEGKLKQRSTGIRYRDAGAGLVEWLDGNVKNGVR